MQARAGELCRLLGGELLGDEGLLVERIAPLALADERSISFLANPRYAQQLQGSAAACVILSSGLRELAQARVAHSGAAILCADPYLAFARLTQWWAAQARAPVLPGVHPSAVVEPGARVHAGASIAALAYVGAGAVVEEGCVIGPQAHVGDDARVGAHTRLAARATLGRACSIGSGGILHSGVVIGADGFGFAPAAGATGERHWEKIEQLGAVRIGNEVEIGANTCIDRGALEDTVVEDGVKLDNLVQIGHNVHIGAHCAFAGCVGVAGSTRFGRHCTVGGAAIILGHLQIADHVDISAATVISRSIHRPGVYSGFFPFDDNAAWEKNAATLRHLHTLRDRVRGLEKALKNKP